MYSQYIGHSETTSDCMKTDSTWVPNLLFMTKKDLKYVYYMYKYNIFIHPVRSEPKILSRDYILIAWTQVSV